MENMVMVNEKDFAELKFYKLELKKLLKRIEKSEDEYLKKYVSERDLEDLK